MPRNHLVKPNSVTTNYLRIGSMGLGACIDKVVEGSDWKNKFSWKAGFEPQRTQRDSQRSTEEVSASTSASSAVNGSRRLPFGKGIGIACSSYICGAGLPIYW